MSSPVAGENKVRVLDPVFMIMLVAILLAVAASMTLRLAVGGAGPSKARADDDAPFVHRAPAARSPATPPSD